MGKYKDNWYRFVVNKIVSDCDSAENIHNNRLTCITFNYDTSFEHHLKQSLKSYELFATEAERFLDGRVLHIYGQVNEAKMVTYATIPMPVNLSSVVSSAADEQTAVRLLSSFLNAADRAYDASKGIRVIDPHDKSDDKQIIVKARAEIQHARCVYILGFGFDVNNSRRLQLERHLRETSARPGKSVMFTNFGDINRINKRASKVIFDTYERFSDPAHPIIGHPLAWYYEKSTRNVYDALDLDFEALEQELLD